MPPISSVMQLSGRQSRYIVIWAPVSWNAAITNLLIEDSLVVEIKSVDKLLPIHSAQLMTYMRLQRVLPIEGRHDSSRPWVGRRCVQPLLRY